MRIKEDIRVRLKISVKVNPETDCWEWQNYTQKDGYGVIGVEGKGQLAHRISYETFKGDIPNELQIDHVCKNKCCINPEHLEAVTCRENVQRHHWVDGRCKRGHNITDPNNIYLHPKTESVRCLTCLKMHTKRKDDKRKNKSCQN